MCKLAIQQVKELVAAQEKAERHFSHLQGNLACAAVKKSAPQLARQLLAVLEENERLRATIRHAHAVLVITPDEALGFHGYDESKQSTVRVMQREFERALSDE